MADRETTIRITGEDNTSRAVRSVVRNVEWMDRQLLKSDQAAAKSSLSGAERAAAARLNMRDAEYKDHMAKTERVRQENARIAASAVAAGRTGGTAMAGMARGLAGVAAGALSVGAAFEFVRRGFMGFAALDTQLRLVENQTGATKAQIAGLAEEIGRVASRTGESTGTMLTAFEELREAANLTLDDAKKIFPQVAVVAKGMGADAGLVGRALGDIMRNFNIPAEQSMVVLEALSHGATAFNLNIQDIGPRLSVLTEMMSYWGYTGVDAAQRMVAFLGTVKEATGDAGKAASVLTNIFQGLGDEQMAKALGFPTAKALEANLRAAEDPLGRLIYLMVNSKDQFAVMKAVGIESVAVFNKLKKEINDMGDNIKGVQQAGGAMDRGQNSLESAEVAVQRLVNSFSELAMALGHMLDTIGLTAGMSAVAGWISDAVRGLERIVSLWEWWTGQKAKPEWFPKTWEEFKYRMNAEREPGGALKVPWEKSPEFLRLQVIEANKRRGLNETGTGPYVPTPEEEIRRQLDIMKGPQTTPKGDKPQGPGGERFGYPAEKMRYELERHNKAVDDATVKLIKFSEALPDNAQMNLWKAAIGVPGARATQADFATATSARPSESATYGGSADVKYLQAAYTPSGGGYLGGVGGSDYRAGPGGGGGTGYGGGSGPGGGAPAGGQGSPYKTGGNAGITAPAGTPIVKTGLATVTTSKGRKFQVDARFAANFQGFIDDYEAAGGDLGPDTGTLGFRPHNPSGHPIGTAIDINQIGRGVRSKAGRGKTLDPAVEDALAEKWGLVSGNRWKDNDQGHFGIRSEEAARAALEKQGGAPAETAADPLATPSEAEAFAIARAAAVKAGIRDPDTAAAIAMHESGFLKRGTGSVFDRSGGTNPFGQTVKPGTPGAIIGADGQPHAKYGSLQEGFDAHFKRWGNRYGATPDETLANLREGGYNTVDPKWAGKIKAIRERNVGAAATATAPAPAPTAAQPSNAPIGTTGERDADVRVNLRVNDNQVQFARTSIKRAADREVREARWNSYADIGAA